MNDVVFNIEKIVNYLSRYKRNLSTLHKWNTQLDKLFELGILSESEEKVLSKADSFEREIKLKEILSKKLRKFKDEKSTFYDLSNWIIQDWGGINASLESNKKIIDDYLRGEISFDRISSSSKIASFMYPEHYIIYDSRVAYTLNWIILSEEAGNMFFPIPEGRNAKMSAFEMNVLIRLKNVNKYFPKEKIDRLFINNIDKSIFIPKKEAYSILNALVKKISKLLWQEEKNKQSNLYFTEMLLFSIADTEIFNEIVQSLQLNIYHHN